MAMLVIERMRRKPAEKMPVADPRDSTRSEDDLLKEAAVRLEKKRTKAESKRLKKKDK